MTYDLVAIMDCSSRKGLSWRISTTLEVEFGDETAPSPHRQRLPSRLDRELPHPIANQGWAGWL
jgi:hypothetical protein